MVLTDIYEAVLLCLSLLALVLGCVVLCQSAQRGAVLRQPARPPMGQVQRDAGLRRAKASPGAIEAARFVPRAKPRATGLLMGPQRQSDETALATVIACYYALARGRCVSAALLAERTLPRLQDHRQPQAARLELGRHRLGLIGLGVDPVAARIAEQCLAALGQTASSPSGRNH